jgi:hypothetical protein
VLGSSVLDVGVVVVKTAVRCGVYRCEAQDGRRERVVLLDSDGDALKPQIPREPRAPAALSPMSGNSISTQVE